MQKWVLGIVGTVVGCCCVAGLSGLVIAGGTLSDVKTLKQNDSEQTKDVAEMSTNIATLTADVATLKVQRKEFDDDIKTMDRKLDQILLRLPR